jgi:glycosyltransferase WbpL
MIYVLTTFALSLALCGLYRLLALHWQVLDTPNERSSHERPTPHGGGAPLLLAFFLVAAVAAALQLWSWPGLVAMMVLAAALTVMGILDDLYQLSARLRFAVYGLASLLVSYSLLQPMMPQWGHWITVAAVLVSGFAVLWSINLYNFMDGIDGIAAVQCVLACAAAAVLSAAAGGGEHYRLLCGLLAAAQLGFLFWNWPPARLFMGDAGSIPTGFLLASLAIMGAVSGDLPIYCWLILLAVFITDSSCTLVWRMASGQRFTEAHRSHAYQRLSRHWQGHLPVTLLLAGIFLVWLVPLAAAVIMWPDRALIMVILAYIPLLAGMAKISRFT